MQLQRNINFNLALNTLLVNTEEHFVQLNKNSKFKTFIEHSFSSQETHTDCSAVEHHRFVLTFDRNRYNDDIIEHFDEIFTEEQLPALLIEHFNAIKVNIPDFETEVEVNSFTPKIFAADDYYISLFSTDHCIYLSIHYMQL